MNPRSLAILAATTAVVVVLAIVAVSSGTDSIGGGSDVAFPKLQSKLDQVAEITLVNKEAKIVVAKKGDGWVLPEKHDYPAQVDKVRGLLLGFEEMKLIERKTAKPDRFGRLNVDDPTGKEARAVRVTLKDASGGVLADVIVGKKKYDLSRTGIAGTYVRNVDSEQAWLGSSEVDPGRTDRLWLARKLMDVKKKRIHRYSITHADGEEVIASRNSPADKNFTLETLPDGKRIKNKSVADNTATTLAFLEFDDVRPAADVTFPAPLAQNEFITFDGLIVRVAVAEIDGDKWARLSVAAGEPIAVPKQPDVKRDTKKDTLVAKEEELPPVAAQVEAIESVISGWLFKLPEFANKNLTARNAQMLAGPQS